MYENGSLLDVNKYSCLLDLFDVGCICNNAHLNGKQVIGQPTEGALLIAAQGLNIPDRRNEVKRVHEVTFYVHFDSCCLLLLLLLLLIYIFSVPTNIKLRELFSALCR